MVALEQMKAFLQLVEILVMRLRGPLSGKDSIIKYSGMKDLTINEAVRGGLPAFKLMGKWYSHTEVIDRWFIEMSMKRINIKREEDLEEGLEETEQKE